MTSCKEASIRPPDTEGRPIFLGTQDLGTSPERDHSIICMIENLRGICKPHSWGKTAEPAAGFWGEAKQPLLFISTLLRAQMLPRLGPF